MTLSRRIPAVRLHAEVKHRPDGLVVHADGREWLVGTVTLDMSRESADAPWKVDRMRAGGRHMQSGPKPSWSRDSHPIPHADRIPELARLAGRLARVVAREADG